MSQTYLDSNNAYDDGNLEIEGYNLINIGPSIEYKRGAVCIYYKNFSPLRVLSNHYLQEYINIELKIGDKFCNFIYLNRSPSQTQDEFKNISENFENNLNDLLQNNPFLVEIIGYFNVKSKHWYCHDKSCLEGDAVDNIAKQYVLHQIIREPTHIQTVALPVLILYFTSQPNSKLNQVYLRLCVLIAIIRLYMLNSTGKYISLHLIYEKFGTKKMPILSL